MSEHKLINVTQAVDHLYKWSGQCACRRWVGTGKSEADLKKQWIKHVNLKNN